MACRSIQSSSSPRMSWKHDVFVSFRGDTRNGFTDHLFGALQRNGIVAFRDDTKLKRGEPIWSELQQAIEVSRVYIVVFSHNYASSTWCLRELAEIFDCVKDTGKRVLPVFYDVDPSEVRKQSGKYGEAFAEHENIFKEDSEMVQSWRGALTQVASLSGWDIRNKPQYVETEKIVEEALGILGHKFSTLPSDLVGWQSPVEELEKLLLLGSNDEVRVVGICGMAGIGKTTLATVLYDRIWCQFDAHFFIDDVSKLYRDCGPHGAQKQLLYQTQNEERFQLYNLSKVDNLIRSRLGHVRALIILDNVDQVEQLENLVVNREWLGAGSRIIIISRDKHLLRAHGVDEIYNIELLNWDNSLQLFCIKAFRSHDIKSDFEVLACDVLGYANGLPLAIKVLGSFLFGKEVYEWRSALARLRKKPIKDIMDVLRISFDGLEDFEKEIFLDIACFFGMHAETHVKKILDIRGFYPDIGIRVLIDKSLITNEHGAILMHDLLQELGKSIVREKAPIEPRKWSRLWDYENVRNVMLDDMVAENLEAIVLQQYQNRREKTMRVDALSKMGHLKLLIIFNVNFSGCLNYLSNELGYLLWYKYPFTCLPPSFQPDKLVELILPHSNIKQLWEDTMPLQNLRYMDLSHSRNLIRIPHFRDMTNLEGLELQGCIKLERIDPTIGLLRKLTLLNLQDCKNLVRIPNNILDLYSLEVLNLSGCSKLLNNQLLNQTRHVKRLKMFDTSELAIHRKSTSSLCKILMLPIHFFYSKRHEDSIGLSLPSLPSSQCFYNLDLSFCSLLQIPDAIGSLHGLEKLNLRGNNFVTLPSSIKELSALVYLNLEHCMQLKYLPQLPLSFVLQVRREFVSSRGLYIFNCPKLAEMERYNIMALKWMNRVLQVPGQLWTHFPHNDVIIPGNQIPRWFKKQVEGGSISMDLSAIMHDSNWVGVAFCVAFSTHDGPSPTNLGNERRPWLGCGFLGNMRGFSIRIPVLLRNDLVIVESDHLWLLYCTREKFTHLIKIYESRPDGTFSFCTDIGHPQGMHFEVKRCGFRWVSTQDLEQPNATMMPSGSSNSIEIDDDLNSSAKKRKFMTD